MNPVFSITTEILNKTVEISRMIGLLESDLQRDLHMRKENRVRSIQSSLAIENNSLTIDQVADVINGKLVLGKAEEIKEVKNAYQAYEEILTYNPYSVTDFLKAHHLMTADLISEPGRFRSGDVGVYDEIGNLVHMGARPQFVHDLVAELFNWAKQDETTDLIKSCIVHYEIEVIHPFADGNGRLGRLWQNVILSNWNPIFAWLPIETIVYQNQQGYYDAIANSNKANDATFFIKFMLDAIYETVYQHLSDKMSDKVSDKMSDKMSDNENRAFKIIATYLAKNETISNGEAVRILGKSDATVRRYFVKFVELELLEFTGERKSRRYLLKR